MSAGDERWLFWVETEDHDEDWFVVATSSAEAATFFEESEGYVEGEAFVHRVLRVPEERIDAVGWASDDPLKACGASFISNAPRVVVLRDQTFAKGALEFRIRNAEDDVAEAAGRGRPNRTTRYD